MDKMLVNRDFASWHPAALSSISHSNREMLKHLQSQLALTEDDLMDVESVPQIDIQRLHSTGNTIGIAGVGLCLSLILSLIAYRFYKNRSTAPIHPPSSAAAA